MHICFDNNLYLFLVRQQNFTGEMSEDQRMLAFQEKPAYDTIILSKAEEDMEQFLNIFQLYCM